MFLVSVQAQTGAVQVSWPLQPPWRVTCDVVETPDGRRVIGRLTLDCGPGVVDGTGVTAGLLRSVRLGPAQAYLALNWPRRRETPRRASNRRGRPATLTPQFYRRVWARWTALVASGHRQPAKALAREFQTSRTAMRSILRRIRTGMPEITHPRSTPPPRRGYGTATRKG